MKEKYIKPELTIILLTVDGLLLTASRLGDYEEEQEGNEWGE